MEQTAILSGPSPIMAVLNITEANDGDWPVDIVAKQELFPFHLFMTSSPLVPI
jgi:hypothetical protein